MPTDDEVLAAYHARADARTALDAAQTEAATATATLEQAEQTYRVTSAALTALLNPGPTED